MNALILLGIGGIIIAAVCLTACLYGDDTIVLDLPADTVPNTDRCMVETPERCPERYALERHGWRLCKHHARELLGGAA